MSTGSRWRVRSDLPLAKVAGAVVFAALAVWSSSGDPAGAFLAAGAAALLGVLALRDLVSPVRLAADQAGLTVVDGFARRRRLDWPQVKRVEVREHSRYGLRWQLLEIETDDDLYQFSAHELGVPCVDAAAELAWLRSVPGSPFAPAPPAERPAGTSTSTTADTPRGAPGDTWADAPAGTPTDTWADTPTSGEHRRE